MRIEKICSALVEFGYEVYIICLWGNEKEQSEEINGINIIRIGFQSNLRKFTPIPFNPFWKKSLTKLINEHKPNLIINREIILADISGRIAKKYNIPIVMDMAENYPSVMKLWKKYSDTFLKKLVYHHIDLPTWLEKDSLKYMNGVITVCDENSKRLENEYGYKGKQVTIYNSPSKEFFDFKRFELKRKYTTIAYHGYINTERNLDNVLDVGKEFNELKFEIWGSGVLLKELKQKYSKYSNIEFFGEYNLTDLKSIIKSTDIGILPYILSPHIHNTISNKMFDYMACGIPVLTSKSNAMMNLISKTGCGYYHNFEDNEEIFKVFSNLDKYDWESKGRNGYNSFIKEFNWESDKEKLKEYIGGMI